MGLKHGEHPFAANRPRSFQCSANFGRMVRVIVNEQKALALIFDLEPASRVLEFTKRSCNFFKRNSKLDRERDHRSEEHTSELQSRSDLVCRLLLEKKNKNTKAQNT